jgi:hypothetical protein
MFSYVEQSRQHERVQLRLASALAEYLAVDAIERQSTAERKRLRAQIGVLLARDRLSFERRFNQLEAIEENDSENY